MFFVSLENIFWEAVRRFYLSTGINNFYPFIGDSLKRSLSEIFFSDASLLNQYKVIAFKISLSIILVISCKILIITVTSMNHTCKILSKHSNINQQELAFLFQVQEELRACLN